MERSVFMKNKGKTQLKIEEIFNNEKDYILLNDFKTVKDKLKIKHITCNTIWEINPVNFAKGNRCPKCANKNRGQYNKHTIQEIKEYIENINGYLCLSDTYINNNTKLQVKHIPCGNEYGVTFINFKKGRRCPYCKKSRPKKSNEYFLNNFKSILLFLFLLFLFDMNKSCLLFYIKI